MKQRAFRPILAALAVLTLAACAGPETPPAEQQMGGQTTYAPQNRPDVRGTRGAVSADHPLAAQEGLRVLQNGGTATDAIIAMAGVLAVVRPHMNGIGGDAFAIFYDGATGEISALNGSGRSGALATPDFFLSQGLDEVPSSATVASRSGNCWNRLFATRARVSQFRRALAWTSRPKAAR